MATTAVTPASINNYLVRFHEYKYSPGESSCIKVWENPYVNGMTEIPRFLPKCSRQTTEAFKKGIDNAHLGSIFFLDPFKSALVVLNVKDLMSFCAANKCCYIAGKSDSVWQQKIKFTFSNLTCIPEAKCRYSPEQQFQIAFNELQYRQRPYLCQYNHNLEKFNKKIPHIVSYEEYMNATEIRMSKAQIELNTLIDLFGKTCVGTAQSIEPGSEQGRCIAALNFIHGEMNNQEAFELTIHQSEVAAMNTPTARVEPSNVEQLLSGYCGMGPEDDYYFSTIDEIFGSGFPLLTDELIGNALSALENIQSTELKMKVFALILINPQVTDDTAIMFYENLPEVLQDEFRRQMCTLNGSTAYDGCEYGLGFGAFMVTRKLRSQIAKDAAFQVYVNLRRKE